MRKFVKFAKRIIAATLSVVMMVSLFQSDVLRSFADVAETISMKNFITDEGSIISDYYYSTADEPLATIKSDNVIVYNYHEDGAKFLELTGAKDTEIYLAQKIVYEKGAVLYRYYTVQREGSVYDAQSSGYMYILATDIMIAGEEPEASATPAPTEVPTESPEATEAPTAEPTENPAPTETPTATPEVTESPEPTAIPTPTPEASISPELTPVPSEEPGLGIIDYGEVNLCASIKVDNLTIYKKHVDDIDYITVEEVNGEKIYVYFYYKFSDNTVKYKVEYKGDNTAISAAIDEGYTFVKSVDLALIYTDSESGVSVSGDIPENVKLVVKPQVTTTDIMTETGMDQTAFEKLTNTNPNGLLAHGFDISLVTTDENGSEQEWQPDEGDTLTVTIDVKNLTNPSFEDGDDFFVMHIHGTSEYELIGPTAMEPDAYKVKDGKVTFQISKFSYLLIMDGTTEVGDVNNVNAVYPVQTYIDNYVLPDAGNGQWAILGVYYDNSNPSAAHLLIGSIRQMPDLNKIDYVGVNGIKYYNPNSKNRKDHPSDGLDGSITTYNKTISDIYFVDDNNNRTLAFDLEKTNFQSLGGLLDIKLEGEATLTDNFTLSLKATTGNDNVENSFNIGKLEVDLHVEIDVQKTVYMVNNVEKNSESEIVKAGDEVTYKIVVTNKSTSNMNLIGVISDKLPPPDPVPTTGPNGEEIIPKPPVPVLDNENIYVSLDGFSWTKVTPDVNREVVITTLNADTAIKPSETRTFYVKASVKTGFEVEADTTYTNTATIIGEGYPATRDTADVIVKAPVEGTLTIKKKVTPEGIIVPDESFTFNVKNSEGKIIDGGNFILQHGGVQIFENLPLGTYIVEEVANSKYKTTVDGKEGVSKTIELTADGKTVEFINELQVGNLKITKNVTKAYENDNIPVEDVFDFVVNISGNDTTRVYNYTKYWANGVALTTEEDENANGTIADGGTLTLKGGQYVIIKDLPLGAYTVTETQNTNYTTEVTKGTKGDTAYISTGNIVATQTSEVEFTNIYTKHLADIKISKDVIVPAGFTLTSEAFSFTVDVNETDSTKVYSYVKYWANGVALTTAEDENANGMIVDGGTLTLKSGQYVIIKDVPIGECTITEAVYSNYTTTVNRSVGNTISLTLTASGDEANFVNTLKTTGLAVSKTVVPAPGFEIPTDVEFEFTVFIEGGGQNELVYKIDDSINQVKNGEMIKLKHGQTAEFLGLPVGANYTVTEKENSSYITTPSNASGTLKVAEMVKASFTNTMKTSKLVIKKNAGVNTVFAANEIFVFDISGPNGYINQVVIKGAGSLTITGLPYGTYTVEEDTDWSYRYIVEDASKEVTLDSDSKEVTFTNSKVTDKWLSSDAYAENIFTRISNTNNN